jgi:hypothetical protein
MQLNKVISNNKAGLKFKGNTIFKIYPIEFFYFN